MNKMFVGRETVAIVGIKLWLNSITLTMADSVIKVNGYSGYTIIFYLYAGYVGCYVRNPVHRYLVKR